MTKTIEIRMIQGAVLAANVAAWLVLFRLIRFVMEHLS